MHSNHRSKQEETVSSKDLSKYVSCTDRIMGRLGYPWKTFEQTYSLSVVWSVQQPRKGKEATLSGKSLTGVRIQASLVAGWHRPRTRNPSEHVGPTYLPLPWGPNQTLHTKSPGTGTNLRVKQGGAATFHRELMDLYWSIKHLIFHKNHHIL